MMFSHRILKRLAKALIRLRVSSGWSEALLVANTTLLEISCTDSLIFYRVYMYLIGNKEKLYRSNMNFNSGTPDNSK